MEQEKKSEIHEEFPQANHGEIGDVTITEYRKNQIVRLAECFIISPLCIYAGIRYRKELPKWLSASLVVFGTATLAYNGSNFVTNWRRDGKLIRQAVKQKKEDEKKIREKMIRVDNSVITSEVVEKREAQTAVVAIQEKKVAPVAEVQKKPDETKKPIVTAPVKVEDKNNVAKNGSEKNVEQVAKVTEAIIAKPNQESVVKKIIVPETMSEPIVTSVAIIEEKKENIESISDKKIEVESVTVEKPIVAIEQPKTDNHNGGIESAKAV